MRVELGEIIPEPLGDTAELLLLLGQIHACQLMRVRTANNFAFSSGDKRVDKTGQTKSWAELEADLTQRYAQRVRDIHPGEETGVDGYLLRPVRTMPLPYEQGSAQ